jgi:hypothetical protein
MNEHTNQSKHPEPEQYMEQQEQRPQGPEHRAAEHHHHYYYGAKAEPEKKPWYSQGWLWLIVAVAAIGTLIVGIVLLVGEVGGVGNAVKEQTGVIREQNGLLASINQSLQEMSTGLTRSLQEMSDGIERIERAIREGIHTILSIFQ